MHNIIFIQYMQNNSSIFAPCDHQSAANSDAALDLIQNFDLYLMNQERILS